MAHINATKALLAFLEEQAEHSLVLSGIALDGYRLPGRVLQWPATVCSASCSADWASGVE